MQIRPGHEAKYRRLHSKVGPELLEALKAAGHANFSLFLYGSTVFAYSEPDTPDLATLVERLAAQPAMRWWRELMREHMVVSDQGIPVQTVLSEVFHLD